MHNERLINERLIYKQVRIIFCIINFIATSYLGFVINSSYYTFIQSSAYILVFTVITWCVSFFTGMISKKTIKITNKIKNRKIQNLCYFIVYPIIAILSVFYYKWYVKVTIGGSTIPEAFEEGFKESFCFMFVALIIIIPCIQTLLVLTINYLWKKEFVQRTFTKKNVVKIFALIFVIVVAIFIARELSIKKIYLSQTEQYSLADFETELKNRDFLIGFPDDEKNVYKKEFTLFDDIALENYSYIHVDDKEDFEKYYNSKAPFIIYKSYISVIEKSNKPRNDYDIYYGDGYVAWEIFFVNGQVYAVIDVISELDQNESVPKIIEPEYGVIVSEDEKITIYQYFKRYFSYGGGIKKEYFKSYLDPTWDMVDINNSDCAEILKVDSLKAETLDELSKDIYDKYVNR